MVISKDKILINFLLKAATLLEATSLLLQLTAIRHPKVLNL